MNNDDNNKKIEKSVLDKINSGEVKMRPKTYFTLKILVLVVVAVLVLVTSAILVSFMIFSLRVSGRLFLLGFGGRGLFAFFLTFPWFILLADILFIILFERLLKHFKVGYRTPLLYTLAATAAVIVVGGFVLDRFSLHETLLHEAMEHRLGPVGGFYTDVRLPPRNEGVYRGIVASTTGSGTLPGYINSFTMRRDDEDPTTDDATDTAMLWQVILPPGVSIAGFLNPGDVVLVAGDVASDTIRAYGIRKITPADEQ